MTHNVHGCRWTRAQPGSLLTGSKTAEPESVSVFWWSHIEGEEGEEGRGEVSVNK